MPLPLLLRCLPLPLLPLLLRCLPLPLLPLLLRCLLELLDGRLLDDDLLLLVDAILEEREGKRR